MQLFLQLPLVIDNVRYGVLLRCLQVQGSYGGTCKEHRCEQYLFGFPAIQNTGPAHRRAIRPVIHRQDAHRQLPNLQSTVVWKNTQLTDASVLVLLHFCSLLSGLHIPLPILTTLCTVHLNPSYPLLTQRPLHRSYLRP